jgi:hypothetical protein
MSNEILAIYAAETKPENGVGYTEVPYAGGSLWVRLFDVTEAENELDAAQEDELFGEAFIDTIHLPIQQG